MCVSGHDSGPLFEEQPSGVIYPEGLIEGKVTLSCQARASPAASYRCVTCTHTRVHTHTHTQYSTCTNPNTDSNQSTPVVVRQIIFNFV